MRKILVIGDAGCESGFAKSTHAIGEELIKSGWQTHVIGINYRGDPHPFRTLLEANGGSLIPAWVPGSDIFGVKRLLNICDRDHPQMILLQNDPWNIPGYMKELSQLALPPLVVGIIAVDGENCLGRALNGLTRSIFWTEFGLREARRGGMRTAGSVVPLGVDLDTYKPMDRVEARKKMGLPADVVNGFVVGNVNRNQPRKRLDLTVRYFAHWRDTLPEAERKGVFLYLHVAPTGDQGIDCEQMAKFYGMTKEDAWLILAEPEMFQGTAEHWVATTLNSFDVQLSTTQGEGWGLTTLEGMACGVPQVVPAWSALAEWAAPAAYLVPCSGVSVTPKVNVVGGVPDEVETISALDQLYRSPRMREGMALKGLELAQEPRFQWPAIGRAVVAEINAAWRGYCPLAK